MKVSRARLGMLLAAGLGCAALDLFVIVTLLTKEVPAPFQAVGWHGLLWLIFALIMARMRFQGMRLDASFLLFSHTFSLLLPGLGMVGMMLVHYFVDRIHVHDDGYFDFDTSLLGSGSGDHLENYSGDVLEEKRNQLDIHAFVDIFAQGERVTQESVIDRLSRLDDRDSISILKSILKKPSEDTTMLAASALIEKENQAVSSISDLQQKLKEDSENPDLHLEIAVAYDTYCYIGLLDNSLLDYYLEIAGEHYRFYLTCFPDNVDIRLDYARNLFRRGDHQAAKTEFEKVLKAKPKDVRPYIWLAEYHYDRGNFDHVREIVSDLSRFETLPPYCKQLIEIWLPEKAQEQAAAA